MKYLSQPLPEAKAPHVRFNDGACDRQGRFFAGTICNKDKGIPGQLWRYDPMDGTCVVVDEGPFTVCIIYILPLTCLLTPRGYRTPTGWAGALTSELCKPLTNSLYLLTVIEDGPSYFTDSLKNIIYAYDYNDGQLSNRRVFIDAIALGLPKNSFADGLCIDNEGCIWSAR